MNKKTEYVPGEIHIEPLVSAPQSSKGVVVAVIVTR